MTDNKNFNQITQYKSDVKEATDSILMDLFDRPGGDMSEYKEEVLDWSWDSIIGN